LNLGAAELVPAEVGNKGVSAGGRAPAVPGLFGALVRQQVHGSEAPSLDVPTAIGATAVFSPVTTPPPGTTDPTSVLPVRLASSVAADSPQPMMGAGRAFAGTAGTDGASATEPVSGKRGELSVMDGERRASLRENEGAGSPASGPSAIVAQTPSLAGDAAAVRGDTATGRIAELTDPLPGPAVEVQPAMTTEKTKLPIGTEVQASAAVPRATVGEQVAGVGAAGPVAASPQAGSAAAADGNVAQPSGETGAEVAHKGIVVPQGTGSAVGSSDWLTPEPVSIPSVSAKNAAGAASGKIASPIQRGEPAGGNNAGATQAAIVHHHEKRPIPRRSAAGESQPTIALPFRQQANAGVAAATAGKQENLAGTSGASSPASTVVPGPKPIETRANLQSNPKTDVRWTGARAGAASPGQPVSATPGDPQTATEPESRLSSGGPDVHAAGTPERPATESVGSHRTAEAQNPDVVSAAGPARNSGGEATTFGSLVGAQPIHAAGGPGNAQGLAPMAVAAPAHVAASVTFERMDTAAAPHVIESTPHRLAVGVDNGGLGWVEIHTSSAAGHVSATLTSGSAESHHAIATQLPAVREFLAGEHVQVDTLASERFSASSGGQRGSSGDQEGGGGRRAPSIEPNGQARPAAPETDSEELSYISVRV
jgi:hypothetical protein